MISEELKGIVDKFKEQGKMDFLEETTEEKISDFEKERSVKLPTKFKEWFQKYRQKENLYKLVLLCADIFVCSYVMHVTNLHSSYYQLPCLSIYWLKCVQIP